MAIAGFGVYWRGGVVEQDEVHIGRIIQLTGAEFAHAKHREPAAACRVRRVRQVQLVQIVGRPKQMRHGERQSGFCKVAQCRGHPLQRPDAADIGDAGCQRDNPLGAPHRGCDPVPARRRRQRRQFRHGRGDNSVRAAGDQRTQARGLADREVSEKGTVAAECAQQRRDGWLCRQSCLDAADTGKALHQALRGTRIVRVRPDCGQAEYCLVHAQESWA